MGNNRKDMSDQRGEGKKHCQRNWDEILEETRRESERAGDVAAAAKLFA